MELKNYRSDSEGKKAFVEEVLSPLMVTANTGWLGATYENTDYGNESVFLLSPFGRSLEINVCGDSLEAIVRDVFKSL